MTRTASLYLLSTLRATRFAACSHAAVQHNGASFTRSLLWDRAMTTAATSAVNNDGSLLTRIRNDMKTAMRSRDKDRVALLKAVVTDVTYAEKNATNDAAAAAALEDAGVIGSLQRCIKKRAEAELAYQSAGRTDLADKERAELVALSGYLPAQLTAEELAAEAERAVASVGATSIKDMGKTMKEIRVAPGSASNQAIAAAIKAALTKAA